MSFTRGDAAVMVESLGDAALAADSRGFIFAWNRPLECLLQIAADDALGRRCCEILGGLDLFGNLYCGARCAPLELARRSEPIRGFRLQVRSRAGELIALDVSTAVLQGMQPWGYSLVHLFRSVRAAEVSAGVASGMPADGAEADGGGLGRLTRRQVDVLCRLASGSSPSKIARDLGISIHTVRAHVRTILEKLDVHSVTQAVSIWLRHSGRDRSPVPSVLPSEVS
jgi:DNA-binding CsgD family transcriptional regulator